MQAANEPPEGLQRVVGLVNRLSQICTQLGDTAGTPGSLLADKLSSIVVVGGQVRFAVVEVVVLEMGGDRKKKGANLPTFPLSPVPVPATL
jgi:hypothetical protein